MLIGTSVMMTSQGTYFSPWFPRQGDAAVFSVQAMASSSSFAGTLIVYIQTKNTTQTDDNAGTPNNGSINIVNANVGSVLSTSVISGLSELVRFKYLPSANTTGGQFMHFRILPPAWEAN